MFETFTESWACILNTLFISFWNHPQTKDIENIENIEKNMIKNLEKEKKFAIWQCVKIMKYNHFHYHDFIKKCIQKSNCSVKIQNKYQNKTRKRKIMKSPKNYKEDTQIFCYYFLKSAVFQHFSTFVQNFPPPLRKNKIMEFTSFVIHSFQNPDFYNKWEKINRKLENTKNRDWFSDTLRQTVNEIDITH